MHGAKSSNRYVEHICHIRFTTQIVGNCFLCGNREGEVLHRRRVTASIAFKLPHRSAGSALCVVMGGAKRSSEPSKHVNPKKLPHRSTRSEICVVMGGAKRSSEHHTPPRALIGSSGEISELPLARNDHRSTTRPPSADWVLGRNFGASAGAERRGHGGEICSRGPDPAEKSTPEDPITTSAPNHVRPRCR